MTKHRAIHPLAQSYLDFLVWVNRGVRLAGGILLVLMSIAVFGSVASRYLTNMSWAWIEEGALFLMIWVVVLGTTLAIEAKHMIAVEAFASLFSGTTWKILKTAVSLTAMTFVAILIVSGWNMAKLAQMQYSITISSLSMFWVYLAIPVGSGLMFLNLLGNLVKLWTLNDQQVSEVLGMTALTGFGLLIFLLFSVPIAFSLGLSGLLGIVSANIPLLVLPQRMVIGLNHFTLIALPFFIFAGALMDQGGISARLIRMVRAYVGHRTGGVAIVTVIAAMIFSSLSGSGSATTAALGSILIPAMISRGYSRSYAASVQAVSGELGIIIPPSITFILFGVATDTSIGDLFMAGVIPGILIGCALIAASYFIAKRKGYLGVEKASWSERFVATREAIWALFMPIIVLGGIYGGIFTATEASVIAVAYAFFVGVVIYREITWAGFRKAINDTLISSGMIMFIIGTATVFSWILTRAQVPQHLALMFAQMSSSPYMFLLIINVFLFVVGMFFDAAPAVVVLAGILTPIAQSFGIDPVHFGVIFAVNMALGMVTPPVGVNLFVACRLAEISMEEMMKDLIPYWAVLITTLAIITYVPQLSLWLPSLLK